MGEKDSIFWRILLSWLIINQSNRSSHQNSKEIINRWEKLNKTQKQRNKMNIFFKAPPIPVKGWLQSSEAPN